MKIGFSSYCFAARLADGSMTLTDVFDWVGRSGADHLEIALVGLTPDSTDLDWNLDDDPALLDTFSSASAAAGVELSSMCIPSSFVGDSASVAAQVARAKHHVELADRLGIRLFRHDVTPWGLKDQGIDDVEATLPQLIEASKEVAQHAAQYGITTSVENHGFFVNGSERVRRVIRGVDEPNFKTTLDVGNFLCVDEDPLVATRLNLPYASIVHLKDFYIRPERDYPGPGWLLTAGGNHLMGSIVGYGDMNMRGVMKAIDTSGFDGYVSIEFEGIEDCLIGAERGLANAKRILDEVR